MPQGFRQQAAGSVQTQRPIPPKGLHTARIWYVCDMGTQEGSYADPGTGKVTPWVKPLIKLGFELPTCPMPPEEGKEYRVFSLWREYTWSMNSKGKFGPFCQAIFGSRFEIIEEQAGRRTLRLGLLDGRDLVLEDMLGVPCKVNLIHSASKTNGLTYANISNVSEFPEPKPGYPEELQYPPIFNAPRIFNISKPTQESFDQMYAWDQDKIKESKEWDKLGPDMLTQTPDLDLPF